MRSWAFWILTLPAFAADWPSFRGPNATGIQETTNLPSEFGPTTNVLWKTALPPGNSSPAIAGNRIYLTAHEGDKLLTFAVDRATGRILWRREAPRPRQQEIERPANGPASATPATDGSRVFVFFQDFGLLAYGPDGNELWRIPIGPLNNPFGHGASPVLAGNTLLMNVDQDTDSFLLAVDKNTGKTLWRTPRPHAQRGYATPVLWKAPDGAEQVLVAGSYRLSAYDVRSGKELWWIRRLPWQVKPTPVVAGDMVFFTTYSAESEPGDQENVPPFAEALSKYDGNKDGKLAKDEIPDKKIQARFAEYLDLDNTGFLEERDWRQLQERRQGENALRAYRLGGSGDVTDSNFLWKISKTLPNVPSPLFYRDVLYMLKEGGIFTSYDPKTGAVQKQARLTGALSQYFASPVAADGKIFVVGEDGKAAVIQAGADWQLLRVNDMEEGMKATPALLDGKIYLRTTNSLYCFVQKN
ncbi:MAG: PQQ-binding-like beta-propeller repeat protein [Bryobacterales bacterium]|nr:PQQ-binding-like beta-propeller repeat protein [Bryobacterales bacterium]